MEYLQTVCEAPANVTSDSVQTMNPETTCKSDFTRDEDQLLQSLVEAARNSTKKTIRWKAGIVPVWLSRRNNQTIFVRDGRQLRNRWNSLRDKLPDDSENSALNEAPVLNADFGVAAASSSREREPSHGSVALRASPAASRHATAVRATSEQPRPPREVPADSHRDVDSPFLGTLPRPLLNDINQVKLPDAVTGQRFTADEKKLFVTLLEHEAAKFKSPRSGNINWTKFAGRWKYRCKQLLAANPKADVYARLNKQLQEHLKSRWRFGTQ